MASHHLPPRDSQGPGYTGYRVQTKDRIYRTNGYGDHGYTYYPVVIVGAGESGICMAYKLKKKLGIDQFRLFDRQSGVGGTWWINRYPGVACDIPAAFYSFSFSPNPKWTVFYTPGPEIYDYLQDVCDKYELNDKIQLNTAVESCRWLPEEEEWEVTLQHLVPGTGDLSARDCEKRVQEQGRFSVYVAKETVRCKILVSAVGTLVEPKTFPDIPGADTFKGQVFHSARWNYDVDFKNKDVVVIGTGCSAAQFVPHLTKGRLGAKSVTQLMRSPPWVVPRQATPMGDELWFKFAPILFTYVPGLLKTLRLSIAAGAEAGWVLFGVGKINIWARKRLERQLVARMKKLAPEKYHEILTPDYSVACKRRIFDDTWYPCLNEPNIELTTLPLTSVHERSVTLGPGRLYPPMSKSDSKAPTEEKTIPADIIVLANGFETQEYLHPLEVAGVGGKDLIKTMKERGGAQAYQGTAMDGFPNFFMIYGPNTTTGHSSVIMASENMTDYAANFIKLVLYGDAKTVDVKKEAEVAYTQDIQAKMKDTVFMKGGCQSWYFKDGWNSTVLPYNQIWFWYRCQFPKYRDWNIRYTTKGIVKMILSRGLRFVVLAAIAAGVYRVRKSELTLKEQLNMYKYILAGGVMYALEMTKRTISRTLLQG